MRSRRFAAIGLAICILLPSVLADVSLAADQNVKPGETITNSLDMKITLIPAGEFLMGSSETAQTLFELAKKTAPGTYWKLQLFSAEKPQHRVRITKPFYMGVYAVTQGEYKWLMNTNPSFFSPSGDGKDKVTGQDTNRFPVEQVSWDDATKFCGLLSAKEGKVYRLPTEAEWEYACRAGTQTPFHFGDKLDGQDANCDGNTPYGTTTKGPFLERTCAVGQYAPNGFGLYDMHGNVGQWCADWIDSDYYANSPSEDPKGPAAGSFRVIRGGGWAYSPVNCRSAYRNSVVPTARRDLIGFRVVCER